ncbi:MAG: lipopolysaccharide heptosyltransferase II [Nitrospira sp.]|nr:lipopolysaccharide heptosyltransferase II [Nitrospira sp.]
MPRKILVRAPNWIGDAVMCEPAVRGLRSLFPEAELTMLAKPAIAELFIAQPGINSVLRYDDKGAHAGMSGKWSLAGTLRRQRFDLAVLFQNAFEAAFLAWLAGIPRRYGYATDGRVLFLTEPVAVPKGPVPVHQVEYYWNLLRPLGLAGGATLPTLLVSADEDRKVDVRLVSVGICSSDIIIGINPGSIYGSAKRWLSDRFAEVAKRLVRRLEQTENAHVAVVILGAKGEESLGEDIATQLGGRSAVLSGATTIRELMAVVKRCRLLITNDTGPMHIAAAFTVPVVAVFGPTDWRTTAPYGQERSIVREAVDCAPCLLRECPIDHRCMTRVSVEKVYEAAIQVVKVEKLESEKPEREWASTFEHSNVPTPLAGYTIFLDRDGTLNPDPGYIKSIDQFELFPGVPEALARLKRAGARLIVVTNQSGIARGFLTRDDLDAVHMKLQGLIGAAGASLDAIYSCPHHPDDGCDCRKPNRGMIDQAVREWEVNLDRSYLIGDHIRDIELAKRIGARSVLVTTGVVPPQEAERLKVSGPAPDWIASSLTEAADWLLSDASRLSAQIGERQVTHP